MVNMTLWIVQIFLALFFLAAAVPKIIGRGLEQWGFSNFPRGLILFIGITELLGAAGLVLPEATGILPWLTPLAAIGLSISVLMATGFHLRANEHLNAIETTLWAAICAIVAMARWSFVDQAGLALAPAALAIALAVLVPAAIVNVVILLRRPVLERAPERR